MKEVIEFHHSKKCRRLLPLHSSSSDLEKPSYGVPVHPHLIPQTHPQTPQILKMMIVKMKQKKRLASISISSEVDANRNNYLFHTNLMYRSTCEHTVNQLSLMLAVSCRVWQLVGTEWQGLILPSGRWQEQARTSRSWKIDQGQFYLRVGEALGSRVARNQE